VDARAFLTPHNEHLVLFPVGVYKALFATVGLTEHWVYRLTVVGAHLVCVALVFVLARRRVGDGLALAASVLILFLGSAYENLLWPFQVGLVASVAAGLGTLLMLDRRDTRGDISACLLLTLSLASGSVGVPEAAEQRRIARDADDHVDEHRAREVGTEEGDGDEQRGTRPGHPGRKPCHAPAARYTSRQAGRCTPARYKATVVRVPQLL